MLHARHPLPTVKSLAGFAAAGMFAAAACGQGAPYNRSINAADISYSPSPDGQSSEITLEVRFATTMPDPIDLSLVVMVAINGEVLPVGGGTGGVSQRIIFGVPGGPGPIPGSLDCSAFCTLSCHFSVNGTQVPGACDPLTFSGYCWCSVPGDINVPGSVCRMIVPGPQLDPGDVISVSFTAMEGAEPGGAGPVLPELDTSDDAASVVVQGPSCAADFDQSGTRDVPDIFAFLSAWFSQDPAAEFDGVPGIAVPDIFAFLSLWFAGC